MPEFLVLFACIQTSGCAETAAQYRVYNPTPFELTEQYSKELEQAVFANYWAPALAYGLGREGTIKLTHNVGLKLSQRQNSILFSYEF